MTFVCDATLYLITVSNVFVCTCKKERSDLSISGDVLGKSKLYICRRSHYVEESLTINKSDSNSVETEIIQFRNRNRERLFRYSFLFCI